MDPAPQLDGNNQAGGPSLPGFYMPLESASTALLVLLPDAPVFTILAVSDAYLRATATTREGIVGRPLFEAFPDNPSDPAATGVRNLRVSLERVIATGAADRMPVQKYDIRGPVSGPFEERYWRPLNTPVLDKAGAVRYLIHHVEDVTKQVQAEAELRHSEQRFRLMADAVPQILWVTDAHGRAEFFNRQWSDYTGVPFEPITAAEIAAQFIHPDDRPATMEAFEAARQSGSTFTVEHRIQSRDGSYCWFLARAEPYCDPTTGEIVRWFGSSTDIHDRERVKRQQAFLFTLTERLRSLTDPNAMMDVATRTLGEHLGVAQVGYGEIDEAQTHVIVHRDWNDGRIQSVVGTWLMDDFGPQFIREMKRGETIVIPDITQDPRTRAPEVVAAYEAIQTRAILDLPLVKHGRMVAILFIHHPEPRAWSPDEVTLVEETCERLWAIVERARAEEELRASEERFRAIVSQATAGIAQVDLSGRFLLVNHRYCAIVGRSLEELMNLRMQDLTHAEHLPDNLARFRHAVETGEPFVIEKRYVRPDGNSVWVSNSVSVVKDAAGRPQSVLAVTHDISERVKAEEELRRTNRGLEEFAHVASHDLQEPLRMVHSYTQLLTRRLGDGLTDEQREFVGLIQHGVKRMEQLIKDLLAYSRTVHTIGELPVSEASLDEALRNALTSVETRAAETSPIITHEPLPTVRGELAQLAHVFQNLLSNALKYRRANEPPAVYISTRMHESEWVISVRDNGIGFDPAQAERIFGLFKRLHREEEYPGTGLGLAICKRIIERYGGRMWAESEPGVGSTFFFSLPVVP